MVAASFYCSLLFYTLNTHLLKKSSPSTQISFLKKERIEKREGKAKKKKTRERKGGRGVEGREILGREGNGGQGRTGQNNYSKPEHLEKQLNFLSVPHYRTKVILTLHLY